MIKTIQWFAYLWLSMLKPRFKLIRLSLGNNIAARDACAQDIARNWARKAISANGSVIKVTGSENVPISGGVLFISNHQSNFDIPIFMGFVPRDKGFIAKKELGKIPVFSMWMRYLGCVFIDRGDARQSLLELNKAAMRMREGHCLVIFPEGTRSNDGRLGNFKSGSFRMALKANVPIVPVTIKGSIDIMPKGTSFIKSAVVNVIISPAIIPDELPEKDLATISTMVSNIIASNLEG
jgi:1-acyl-sn-glycerol-3-phosphate acyltransferase